MNDDSGVAGFFEDVPVLLIVLGGVCMLVLSGARISERVASDRSQARLDAMAEQIVDVLVSEWAKASAFGSLPLLASVARVNLSEAADDVTLGNQGYKVCMFVLHPDGCGMIAFAERCPCAMLTSGYSAGLMCALDETGRTVILEVRAVVW